MKKAVIQTAEFILSIIFFIVIPCVLFFEMFPARAAGKTSTPAMISFGLIAGFILIYIVVKRFVINPRLEGLCTRIGILKDKAYTESDIEVCIKSYKKIALLKNLRTAVNMIVPIIIVVFVVVLANFMSGVITKVCTSLEQAQHYIGRLNKTILLSSVSFAFGVLVQFVFPWIELIHANKIKESGNCE